jgi:hypothetical protein
LNRLSQLHGTSPGDLAEKLTEELRASGDLDLASPSFEDRMYVFLASFPSHTLTVLLLFCSHLRIETYEIRNFQRIECIKHIKRNLF